jgi:hypothetical protein
MINNFTTAKARKVMIFSIREISLPESKVKKLNHGTKSNMSSIVVSRFTVDQKPKEGRMISCWRPG